MSETVSARQSVELAVIERSGFVESRHLGVAAVVTAEGAPLAELGDVEAPIFPRSTLKAFQAVAVLGLGAELDGERLAIAQASHGGAPRQLDAVRALLGRAGVPESALGCPPDRPGDRSAREAFERAGERPAPIYMNCSGKHAAMLAACRAQGWPLEGYLDPGHPLQLAVKDTIERLTSTRPVAIGVDGCGAPVLALPTLALARGVARLRTANPSSPFPLFRNASRVMRAALEHGWAIDGTGRPDQLVIDRLGVYAKTGAEGVLVMAAPDGTSLALKVLDGSSRAATLVGLRLLAAAGAIDAAAAADTARELDLAVLGGGRQVGAIRIGADVPSRIHRPA